MVGSVWRRSLKCGGAAGGRDGLVVYLDGDGGSLDCIYTGESVRYKTTRCGNYILTFLSGRESITMVSSPVRKVDILQAFSFGSR